MHDDERVRLLDAGVDADAAFHVRLVRPPLIRQQVARGPLRRRPASVDEALGGRRQAADHRVILALGQPRLGRLEEPRVEVLGVVERCAADDDAALALGHLAPPGAPHRQAEDHNLRGVALRSQAPGDLVGGLLWQGLRLVHQREVGVGVDALQGVVRRTARLRAEVGHEDDARPALGVLPLAVAHVVVPPAGFQPLLSLGHVDVEVAVVGVHDHEHGSPRTLQSRALCQEDEVRRLAATPTADDGHGLRAHATLLGQKPVDGAVDVELTGVEPERRLVGLGLLGRWRGPALRQVQPRHRRHHRW